MRKPSSLLLLPLLFGLLAACETPAPEPDATRLEEVAYAPGDTITVLGALIDAQCYAGDENLEADCAGAYARQGSPVGVLVDREAGRPVWILVTVPQALADYMAGTVRVTGRVRSKGVLIPHRIELQRGDGWTFIM